MLQQYAASHNVCLTHSCFSLSGKPPTAGQATKNVKSKDGKVGVKMLALKFGDLRYWGSDLFERFEQQVRACRCRVSKLVKAPELLYEFMCAHLLYVLYRDSGR